MRLQKIVVSQQFVKFGVYKFYKLNSIVDNFVDTENPVGSTVRLIYTTMSTIFSNNYNNKENI